MDLIVNKVMELEVIHDTHGYGVIERLAGTAVVKHGLAVDDLQLRFTGFGVGDLAGLLTVNIFTGEYVTPHTRHLHAFENVLLVRTVENGGHDLPAELACGNAEVDLKHLTDVHSGRNAQRVKNDIKGSSVGQERHILGREYT